MNIPLLSATVLLRDNKGEFGSLVSHLTSRSTTSTLIDHRPPRSVLSPSNLQLRRSSSSRSRTVRCSGWSVSLWSSSCAWGTTLVSSFSSKDELEHPTSKLTVDSSSLFVLPSGNQYPAPPGSAPGGGQYGQQQQSSYGFVSSPLPRSLWTFSSG